QQPVLVTNNSNHSIDLNLQLAGQADYNISGCGGLGGFNNLSGGSACTIQVVFSPHASGPQSGTLTVAGQDVSLTGRGTTNTIGVAPGSLGFGNQPVSTSSAPRTVTVTNTGSEILHVGTPSLGGSNPLQFTVSDNCQAASPLSPGDQCTMTVAFAPTTPGGMSATLLVNSDANSSPGTVNLTGNATPSAVTFVPAPVLFKRSHHAGTFSTPKTVTLTNRTSGPLTISRVHLGGQNPNSFRITGGNCAGQTIGADASCTETVRFAPNEVGLKAASLLVNDDGPNGPHSVQLTGTSTYPKDDVAVHGAAGCDATKLTWRRGGSSRRFDRTVIVRSRTHIPTGPNDGTRIPHGAGVLHDRGLRHFTAYEYRVFALYRSHTQPGTLNHSRGIILRLRTGEICTPTDGGVISDTTPTISWLRHSTLFGYSFLIFHAGDQVQQKRSVHATSFTLSGRRHLHHGFTYTLFLYAYPPSQPEGTSIGRTTFRVR
ncbi:MAG: choice-of-anchor D domain-containing protein, partial [Gaiellales bacterium]